MYRLSRQFPPNDHNNFKTQHLQSIYTEYQISMNAPRFFFLFLLLNVFRPAYRTKVMCNIHHQLKHLLDTQYDI